MISIIFYLDFTGYAVLILKHLMENYKKIWDETLDQIKSSASPAILSEIDNLTFKGVEGDIVKISVPSAFRLAIITKNKCDDLIKNTFSEKAGSNYKVNLEVDEKTKSKTSSSQKLQAKDKNTQNQAKTSTNTTLNKKYSFDNFVYGENSDLAFKAAQIIARNPGASFNPCLIYGGVGLGKTHLLQAIGNYIDEHDSSKKIIYVTAESFTNEFISCFGAGESSSVKNKFKHKYRNADVLLIDDIHFLQKKDSTQEELFHTFNSLYEDNKQIVFTCDRPITELTDITDRLRSRFTKGLNVDLRPPQYEVRMAIAKQKCKEMGFSIPEDTLDFICQSVRTNVRDLEGALTTVSAVSQIIGKPATIELAKEHLKDVLIDPIVKSNEYTINDIFTASANYFNVSLVDLKGNSRSKNIKVPRQIAIYFAYKYGKFTQSEIGSYLDKDHTSIGYTIKTMEPLIEVDDSINQALKDIKSKLEEK